jgi:hypothetical protein
MGALDFLLSPEERMKKETLRTEKENRVLEAEIDFHKAKKRQRELIAERDELRDDSRTPA